MTTATAPARKTATREEWLKARLDLMAKEKELTRQRDEVNQLRLEMPWRKLDKNYVFETVDGKKSLAELFGDCGQLAVYHFMFGPDWEEGCPSCSLLMDNIDGTWGHLKANDVSFVAVSRAPLAKLEAFRKRMGWNVRWASSFGTDFNRDFGVSFTEEEVAAGGPGYNFGTLPPFMGELHGFSSFAKDERGQVFHTYSTYARGAESLLGIYGILDMMPKGREKDTPQIMAWVRHHDKYDAKPKANGTCCH